MITIIHEYNILANQSLLYLIVIAICLYIAIFSIMCKTKSQRDANEWIVSSQTVRPRNDDGSEFFCNDGDG